MGLGEQHLIRYPHEFSGGQRQRIAVARALSLNPSFLILDEPTAVLTPSEVKDLFKILKQLTSKGVSVIFITHKLKEAMEIADVQTDDISE